MDTLEIFRKYKKTVVDGWAQAVFATYPLDTTGFSRIGNDPFTNPAAHMTRQAAAALFDALAGEETDQDTVRKAVERFVRLRAVQKFGPAEGLAVFYLLKPLLRQSILPEMEKAGLLGEYLEAESRLDTLALMAFDIYVQAREALAEARIREIRSQHAQLARWARRQQGAGTDNDGAGSP